MLLRLPGLSPWAEWWPFSRIPIKLQGGACSNGTCRPLPVCFGPSPTNRLAAFHRGGLLGWCAHGQQISRQCCSWENPGGFSGAAAKEVHQSATPIGQQFSLNTQKVNQSTAHESFLSKFVLLCGFNFRDLFNQRTNNIYTCFPDRLYRQDPATMLGGLFAFAK